MPHSSGGGSHGGGSHYSSSGGSSFGSGALDDVFDFTNTRLSRKPYGLCSTYCYYRNKRPVYVYADYSALSDLNDNSELATRIIAWFLLCPLLFIIGGWIMNKSFDIPKKLTPPEDIEILIADDIDVLTPDEEKELRTSLEAFFEETGIVPAVVTVKNEDWKEKGSSVSFESVAYDEYVKRFSDEMHWLIMYSQPAVPDPEFNDWFWEGMQGNDTDSILSYRKTSAFTDSLQKRLLDDKLSVGEALIASMDEITAIALERHISVPGLLISLIPLILGIVLTIYIFNIHPIRKAILKKSVRVSEFHNGLPKEETCNYCGGIFVVGAHLNCPHCGAAVPAHDYTVDDQGNVKKVLR